MPQMAPYNWLMLFLLFNIIMIFMNSFNYFMVMKIKKFSTNKSDLINYKWLW